MKTLKKRFRNIQKLPDWLFFFPALLLKGLRRCHRLEVIDPNNYIEKSRGVVTVTWHNRLLFFPAVFPKATRQRTVAVVSPSRDGQYITDLISFFGIKSLRGSSSKRGSNAQLGAMRAIKNGLIVSFTPDGPRGPKYKLSRGPIHLASTMNTTIIPISINASSYWQIKSWDNFQIPKPFAKLTLILGDEIKIPPNLNSEELETYRRQVENELLKITQD